MTITAYSDKFGVELDTVQLLSRLGHDVKHDPALKKVGSKLRELIHSDIKCPSCGVVGANIVAGSFSEKLNRCTRQPHFRFTFSNGEDGHDKFCDLSENQELKDHSELKVNFSRSNSNITKYIANLTCVAMENNLITHSDLRKIRQWHFDKKKSKIVNISVTHQQCFDYQTYRLYKNYEVDEFQPEYGLLDNIPWRKYAISRFMKKNSALINKLHSPTSTTQRHVKEDKIASALKNIRGGSFDVRVFESEYLKVRKFRDFVISDAIGHSRYKSTPSTEKYIDAFLALLLSKKEWDLNGAIRLFIKITTLGEARDKNIGNIISLTPFVDFEVYKLILDANDLSKELSILGAFQDNIKQEVQNLKLEFETWEFLYSGSYNENI
ncbi:hypothetical protein [Moritella sp.]|uniref:hypothetical protein n=1 Tax=Moritella sp. TaxID=78556 RepID=UPI0025CCC246|nr:hypothetical protein [Moritella sp.]MCJ8351950.1 hypothetical protein [Moritella sp.]